MSLFTPRKSTDWLVIHCTATPEGKEFHAKDIDRMHRERGLNGIGYHFIVCLDGTVEKGRPENMIGAHVEGFNSNSVGISYIGGVDAKGKSKDTRTPAQKVAIVGLLKELRRRYPHAKIQGHRDFPNVHKDCPCFNAKLEYVGI